MNKTTNLMTGAAIILRALKDNDIEYIFCYSDYLYIMKLSNRIIKHILVRHGQEAGHDAEGYARSTNKVAVMLVTSGPWVTNAITPLQDAFMDSIPIVCVARQVHSTMIGSNAFQACDTSGITWPSTKHNWLVKLVKDVNNLARVFHQAFRIAQLERPGPVVIDTQYIESLCKKYCSGN